jgi:hypothetical protein
MKKKDKVLKLLAEGKLSNARIADKVKCSRAYVTTLSQKAKADDKVVRPRVVGPHKIMRVEGVTAKQMKDIAYQASRGRQAEKATTTDVGAVLDARGKRYGPFAYQAQLSQKIKSVFTMCGTTWPDLKADQREALDMIASKLGRILNGDPDYVDSWTDIAGYATLVADRLEGKVR